MRLLSGGGHHATARLVGGIVGNRSVDGRLCGGHRSGSQDRDGCQQPESSSAATTAATTAGATCVGVSRAAADRTLRGCLTRAGVCGSYVVSGASAIIFACGIG